MKYISKKERFNNEISRDIIKKENNQTILENIQENLIHYIFFMMP